MDTLGIPGFVTPMGKGALDETNPHFGGVYIGDISLPKLKKAIEGSDCVLSIGALLSDFNTVASRLSFSGLYLGFLQLSHWERSHNRISFLMDEGTLTYSSQIRYAMPLTPELE
jgi:thiamine pyrophosphate-dependent acetolactate synthase large subunit-like protein